MAVVVDGIVAMQQPVADVDVDAAWQAVVFDHRGMAVAEHAVVEVFLLQPLTAIDDDAFAVVALVFEYLGVLLDVAFTAVVAPCVGDAEGET